MREALVASTGGRRERRTVNSPPGTTRAPECQRTLETEKAQTREPGRRALERLGGPRRGVRGQARPAAPRPGSPSTPCFRGGSVGSVLEGPRTAVTSHAGVPTTCQAAPSPTRARSGARRRGGGRRDLDADFGPQGSSADGTRPFPRTQNLCGLRGASPAGPRVTHLAGPQGRGTEAPWGSVPPRRRASADTAGPASAPRLSRAPSGPARPCATQTPARVDVGTGLRAHRGNRWGCAGFHGAGETPSAASATAALPRRLPSAGPRAHEDPVFLRGVAGL